MWTEVVVFVLDGDVIGTPAYNAIQSSLKMSLFDVCREYLRPETPELLVADTPISLVTGKHQSAHVTDLVQRVALLFVFLIGCAEDRKDACLLFVMAVFSTFNVVLAGVAASFRESG